jgi:transcriptional regulator with XRE-family HTH domain
MLNLKVQDHAYMLINNFCKLSEMELNERIRRAIKISGVKGKDVAEACGVTPGAVSQWMAGSTSNLKFTNLYGLSDITGFSARWIALEEGPERMAGLPGVQLASHEAALLDIYRDLSSRDKEMLFGIIRGMKSVDIPPPKSHGKQESKATG